MLSEKDLFRTSPELGISRLVFRTVCRPDQLVQAAGRSLLRRRMGCHRYFDSSAHKAARRALVVCRHRSVNICTNGKMSNYWQSGYRRFPSSNASNS